MNEEEKDSIEILKNTDLDINTIYSIDLHTYNYAVKTVLNLLEKKDKQLEQYQNMLATNDMLHVLECEKKDKMIDEMAIAIGNEPLPTEEYCIFRNFDCPAVGGNRDCKECVKQYFENKVTDTNVGERKVENGR